MDARRHPDNLRHNECAGTDRPASDGDYVEVRESHVKSRRSVDDHDCEQNQVWRE